VTKPHQIAQETYREAETRRDLVVLIPVHDPKEEYEGFLTQAILSVGTQTIQPKCILLVANHELPYLPSLEACAKEVEIRFVQSRAVSAADNINFGVALSGGHFTKILFQDDFLAHDKALENSVNAISVSGAKWSVCGSRDWDENSNKFFAPTNPKYSERLDRGINTIGAPSVVTFETEFYTPMDARLHYMFDCDWYLSMAHNFGRPVESSDIAVTIRRHPGQATSWAKQLLKQEKVIVKANHRKTRLLSSRLSGNCSCSQHL
jgi:hypothetical protein